jgi:hypothetical protein
MDGWEVEARVRWKRLEVERRRDEVVREIGEEERSRKGSGEKEKRDREWEEKVIKNEKRR